jgi:pseudouridine kinase
LAEIIVIGGANIDIKAKSLEVNHFATSNPGTIATAPGGVGRNIAHNLARLGVEVALISSVGDDFQGASVLQASKAAGIDVSRVSANAPSTGTYIAVLNPDGEMLTALSDMRAIDGITPDYIRAHAEAISAARFVVADCNLPIETLRTVAELARDNLFVEPVSVPKSAKLKALLQAGHVFMASPNLDQIESLTGTMDVTAGCSILHGMGLQHVIAHAGREGAFVSNGDTIEFVEAQPAGPVIDVTGAGDAAVAGLLFGLLRGEDLFSAALLGQKLAGRVIASNASTLE